MIRSISLVSVVNNVLLDLAAWLDELSRDPNHGASELRDNALSCVVMILRPSVYSRCHGGFLLMNAKYPMALSVIVFEF